MASIEILPDSRLLNETLGSKMVDWALPSGRLVRIEVVPLFCANCGADGPYAPKDNTASAFYLCQQCADTYGEIANTMMLSDEEYARLVAYEMEERFGHALNPLEIAVAVDQDLLGKPLEALLRDSPYPSR